jgi:hypothetical protein
MMKKNTELRNSRNRLSCLHHEMQQYYVLFQLGFMSEKEYLAAIKPLDEAIDALEISTLKVCFVSKEASSAPFHAQEK